MVTDCGLLNALRRPWMACPRCAGTHRAACAVAARSSAPLLLCPSGLWACSFVSSMPAPRRRARSGARGSKPVFHSDRLFVEQFYRRIKAITARRQTVEKKTKLPDGCLVRSRPLLPRNNRPRSGRRPRRPDPLRRLRPAPGTPTLRMPGGESVTTAWSVVSDCGEDYLQQSVRP